MPPTAEDSGEQGPPDPVASPLDGLPALDGVARPSLWLLLVPVLLYGAAPFVANRVEPRILGVPFLLAWVIAATVISPLVIWLAARLDPAYRANAVEPIPADDLPGTDAEGGRR
ncbi:hypothetical protein GCM10010277_57980 [Streptomyces longisporoflavus]|uniref:DUF3311 domain-containing protein n=1 Tax=Streptomyces longisporoflavus TaxID=28044 RepID=UPI00167D5D82|nr:DUF3311 domain-containing protein [Streptomyces longisporoflavus]GGV56561.1 hypothetical protein GCM10010277_57980 [Streptomyces longisporoflavus]